MSDLHAAPNGAGIFYSSARSLERWGHFDFLAGSNYQILTLCPDVIVEE